MPSRHETPEQYEREAASLVHELQSALSKADIGLWSQSLQVRSRVDLNKNMPPILLVIKFKTMHKAKAAAQEAWRVLNEVIYKQYRADMGQLFTAFVEDIFPVRISLEIENYMFDRDNPGDYSEDDFFKTLR